jgi:hypothetical protein
MYMKQLALLLLLAFAAAAHAAPETVAITYRFTPANEAALRTVIDQHWSTLTRLKLVDGGHQLYRGSGFFLEVFTWKDDAIPDDPPAEVLEHWKKMNALVDGKNGLRIDAVQRVDAKE